MFKRVVAGVVKYGKAAIRNMPFVIKEAVCIGITFVMIMQYIRIPAVATAILNVVPGARYEELLILAKGMVLFAVFLFITTLLIETIITYVTLLYSVIKTIKTNAYQ